VVGSGVYLLPAAAAAYLGALSLGAVALAGLAVALVVLCYAEAASRFDQPGSGYLYARAAFGELVGFEVGWMTWLARVASLASLAVGFAQAVGYLWPAVEAGAWRTVTVVGPVLVLTAINLAGVRFGVGASLVLVLGKLLPLTVFVGAGLAAASWERLAGQRPVGEGSLGEAALLLLFAYAGFENTPAPAGEFRNPKRDVPFALATEVALVTLLYTAVQAVALATLPELGSSKTPLADAARLFLGEPGGWLLTVGAAIGILGTNGNTVLAGPRYLFALARDGFGPRWLAKIHPRFHTPAAALLLQTGVALPLALSGTFTGLAALSVVARLTGYVTTALAVPVLRRKLPAAPGAFRLPGGPAIPIAAALVGLGLAASAHPANLLAAAVALAVGLLIYALRRR
jgi:amino acid transporter